MYSLTRPSTRANGLSNNRSRRFISIRQLRRATLLGLTVRRSNIGVRSNLFGEHLVHKGHSDRSFAHR
jgi:hypothetical protein